MRKGIRLGVAMGSGQLRNDPGVARLVQQHDLGLVPEWEMKWHALWPSPNHRDASGLDALAAFARDHRVPLRGHTVVWHASMPTWALAEVKAGKAMALLTQHMGWLAERYDDQIQSWDVVNEAIWLPHGQPQGMRLSPWLEGLGPGYVETAFRLARSHLPNARLVYNDYDIEHDPAKADAVLLLVRSLRDKGVPIDAIGLQSHLFATRRNINETALRRFCRECRRDGLEVLITELDVRESDFDGPAAARDERAATVLARYLDAVLAEVLPKELYFWGLTDRYSWLSNPKYNPENPRGHRNRGLPFDENFQPKRMWDATMSRLKALSDIR